MTVVGTSMKLIFAASMGAALSIATPSYSAGDGGGSATTVPSCKKGKVWDKKKKKCVKVQKSSNLSDDNLYEAARDLAYNRRYEEALKVLELASNQNDPRILNYKGYSTRKLGRVEEGMKFYVAALAVNPDYHLAREYMAEAFLQLGKVDKAREQLAELGERCGTDCREYKLLDDQIKDFVARS